MINLVYTKTLCSFLLGLPAGWLYLSTTKNLIFSSVKSLAQNYKNISNLGQEKKKLLSKIIRYWLLFNSLLFFSIIILQKLNPYAFFDIFSYGFGIVFGMIFNVLASNEKS